ncbi:radial spoke head protein 9 homolog [Diabrotica virgifera virgifera]|uniref:Radial spoke head protein 9 homolog n=1 Tax=Diabrotica virgifera virgifera TaxID=50390 RepID=A0A6P7FP81_DIAVI|nr:radial spoke head protein 9 homolog [Diabrotica virgifera virgifera]
METSKRLSICNMNLNYILNTLDSSGYFGHVISTEESIILQSSLLILQNENHFKEIYFWGKILGAEKDYYIAYGYQKDILHGRVFYYSRNCVNWGLLPKPTQNGLSLTPLCTTKFQGDPSMIIEIVIEQDETLISGKRKQPEIRKLKEEDRLASTVYLIMEESAVIPRAGIFRQPDGVIVNNLGFEGLHLLDAREWSSFLHLRVPTRKQNTNLLTKDDYNYATDFLDPIDNDIPEGCWMIQITQSEDLVILKSMYWPGLIFFHNIKTPKHGFIYFGHGKKCLDVPFMLSPFFT